MRKTSMSLILFFVFLFGQATWVLATDAMPPEPPEPPQEQQPPSSEVPAEQPRRTSHWRESGLQRRYLAPIRPIGVVRVLFFENGDETPLAQSFGVSFGLKYLQPFELEVGFSAFDLSYSAFANTGISWNIYSIRNHKGQGIDVRMAGLIGYRFLRINDAYGIDDFHAATTTFSIETNFWLAPHFGLHFQLAGGVGFWFQSTDPHVPPLFPEFRAAFGVSF